MSVSSRWPWIDWLRGLAVVFMVEIHTYDAWLADVNRTQDGAWFWAAHLGGFAAPLFLFLAGLMLGVRPLSPAKAARRGLEVIAWGYLFRLVLIALEGFSNLRTLPKVDILQQIGFSLLLCAPLLDRRFLARYAVVALLGLLLLMPLVTALPQAPTWIRPLTDYVTGGRPMSFFPAFPWAGYTMGGLAVGACLRDRNGRPLVWALLLLFAGGVAMAYLVKKQLHPWVIAHLGDRGPNHGVDGAVRLLYRLGICVALVPLAHGVAALLRYPWGPLLQMGRTSLTLYVVHVPLVYGPLLRRPFKKQLDLTQATWGVVLVLLAMLGVSVFWERIQARWKRRSSA